MVGWQSATMWSSSLRPNCEFCSTGIAPIQMTARNAAANSVELSHAQKNFVAGRRPCPRRSFTKANTMRWNSALVTGSVGGQEGAAIGACRIAAGSQR